MIAEHGFHGGGGVAEFGEEGGGKLELEEGVCGFVEIRAVAEPPGLLRAGHVIDVDVFGVDHFEEAGFAVGASPAAEAAAAVGGFGDGEVADGVVDHDGAGAESAGDGFAAVGVGGPDAGGEGEGGIVGASDGFFGIANGLYGEDGAESFFLEEAHGIVYAGDYGGLEEIGAEVGTRMAAAEDGGAVLRCVCEEI